MTECAFFDDQQPTDGLPRWATITQVSSFLAVPRTTVRDTVRRALTSSEPWVKKEESEDGKSLYLIDTIHETYRSHKQRWKQNQIAREEDLTASPADWYHAGQSGFSHLLPEEISPPYASSSPFSHFPWHKYGSSDDVLHRWPVFRQRLHFWGIQVFQNILAEEGQENPWQWRWGNLHGEGYPSEEEAIIAAIESRLIANEDEDEDQSLAAPSLFPPSTPTAQAKPQRFNFFSRRNGLPPF